MPLHPLHVVARRIPPPGDLIDTAIALAGGSGTVTLDMGQMTSSSTDPSAVGDPGAASAWLTFTAAAPGTLELDTSGAPALDAVLEVYDAEFGPVVANDDADDVGPGEHWADVMVTVADGLTYLVKVAPKVPLSSAELGDWAALPVAWSFASRMVPLVVEPVGGDATVPWTPTQLKVNVLGADPGQTVDFRVDDTGSVVDWFDADEAGTVTGFTVNIPTLADGAHSLDAYAVVVPGAGGDHDLDVTGNHASFSFTVQNGSLEYPVALDGDAAPISVARTGVQRWVLQDPAPGGGQYVFEINPDRCGSRNAAKRYTVDVTTAFDGQALTWEGARQSALWWFSGTLLSQSQLAALQRFTALQRRFWLIDEHNDAWVVTFEKLEAVPKITADQPWLHTYRVEARILAGPVSA